MNKKVNRDLNKHFWDTGGIEWTDNHDLNSDSKIIELGGYTGRFIQSMISRYDPYIYVIEPVSQYYIELLDKFSNNKKINILNCGISAVAGESIIFKDNDGSSRYLPTSNSEKIHLVTMKDLFDTWKLDEVDLLQINIEGDEYEILNYLLDTDMIRKFKNLQIQFHHIDDDSEDNRRSIQQRLIDNGFVSVYNFDFIWEKWKRND